MKLSNAYFCPDCNEVFDWRGHLNQPIYPDFIQFLLKIFYYDYPSTIINKNPVCPVCNNKSLFSLSRVLNRKEDMTYEKHNTDIHNWSTVDFNPVSKYFDFKPDLSGNESTNNANAIIASRNKVGIT